MLVLLGYSCTRTDIRVGSLPACPNALSRDGQRVHFPYLSYIHTRMDSRGQCPYLSYIHTRMYDIMLFDEHV